MLYVQRDAQGQLLRVEAADFAGASETLRADDQQVQAWYANQQGESSLLHLKQSDLHMIRVLDDVLQLLTNQGTDLPAAAQAKLLRRAQTRSAVTSHPALINDDESGVI